MADSSKIVLNGEKTANRSRLIQESLEVIMGIAAEKVDGVAGMRGNVRSGINWVFGREDRRRGVNVKVDKDNKLIADVYVYVESGVYVPKVAVELQKH